MKTKVDEKLEDISPFNKWRHSKGLSYQVIADAADIPYCTVARWGAKRDAATGKFRHPRGAYLEKVKKAYPDFPENV